MAFDTDSPGWKVVPSFVGPPANPRDLEATVTLLELAALSLSPKPGVAFSREELIREAREMAGPDFDIEEGDIDIVLGNPGFLKKLPGGKLCLK